MIDDENALGIEHWIKKITAYDTAFKKWEARVTKIIKRYKDDNRGVSSQNETRFNILWSNVNTIIPAVFSRLPKPDISRRFRDNDPVGRVASLILERALDYEIEHYPDYRATLKNVVLDRFLGGRGVAWIRYEPHFIQIPLQPGQPEDGVQITEDVENEQYQEVLHSECSPVDYVHWKDFGHSIARTWEEVETIWRKVYMGRDSLIERFGDLGEKIPLDTSSEKDRKQYAVEDDHQALIYEIWDKSSGKAIWLSKSMNQILDERDDPLGLENFFPCEKPLYATLSTDDLVPVPDFSLYQDQANELDLLATRIDGLVNALRIRGVYDGAQPELARLFKEAGDNELIPVKNWQAFTEKNGLKGAIDLVDIAPIANALAQAYQAMEHIKSQIFEITGLSDIIRGSSEAAESATAQKIKSQFGSLRLRSMQTDVAIFATGLLRIKAQIMCKLFQPETLIKISAAMQLSQQDQMFIQPAIQLLKSGELSSFRIDIEADSLIQMDELQEKQDRMEFLQASGSFLKQAVEAGQQMPQLAPLMMDMLKYGVTGFKVGKTIEGQFDEAADMLKQLAQQAAQNPKPNPEMMKIQAQQQMQQQEQQHEQQLEQFKVQQQIQQRQQELQMNAQAQEAQAQREMQLEQWKQTMQAQQVQHQNDLEAQREIQKQQLEAAVIKNREMLEAQAEVRRMEFEQWRAQYESEQELKKAALQSATQVEIATISATKNADLATSQNEVAGSQVAQTSQIMSSVLERQDRILATLIAPKDMYDETGKVIRTVVSRGAQ